MAARALHMAWSASTGRTDDDTISERPRTPRAATTTSPAVAAAAHRVGYTTLEKIRAALEEGVWRQGLEEEDADVLCAVGLTLLSRSHPYSMDLPAVGERCCLLCLLTVLSPRAVRLWDACISLVYSTVCRVRSVLLSACVLPPMQLRILRVPLSKEWDCEPQTGKCSSCVQLVAGGRRQAAEGSRILLHANRRVLPYVWSHSRLPSGSHIRSEVSCSQRYPR
jgi:hypothetical protein